MFGKSLIRNKKHCLLAVRKNNIYYCASYDNDDYCEVITSINTGEKFYSLASFVQSIIGPKPVNEFSECLYYSSKKNKWRQVKYLYKKL
jgi:hypothetical protein